MMLKAILRPSLVVGWVAVVTIAVLLSVATHAALSTTLLLFALGIAPAILMIALSDASPSPTIAQILHSVETDARR